MSRLPTGLCVVSLAVALIGCNGASYDGPQRFPISGKVTVDGQPVDAGVISFVPKSDGARVSGGPILNGMYKVEEEMGPTAGSYQVKIHWNKKTGKQVPNPMDRTEMIDELTEGVPKKYWDDNSVLNAEVSADKTTFDFDLKTTE